MQRGSLRSLFALLALLGLALLGSCTPSIGDPCSVSSDCSIRGDRVCDSSQPEGYCTIKNCGGNTCPNDGACVLFGASLLGCPYDDRTPARTARTFCMAHCDADKDCRSGYICADPKGTPWNALVLDDDQTKRVCIPSITSTSTQTSTAATPVVCSAAPDAAPPIDASPGWANDATRDSGMDAARDGAPRTDAGTDAQ